MKRKSKTHVSKVTLPLIVAETAADPIASPFRAQALNELSEHDFETLLEQKAAFEEFWNGEDLRLSNRYKTNERNGKQLITDRLTGLTWQRSGSPHSLSFAEAEQYVNDLNKQRFAGHGTWRLPILDEAMSLMMPYKDDGALYIDSMFDQTQQAIWTEEETFEGTRWVVTFCIGNCYVPIASHYYVRAVRGEYWTP
ncbi:DUF1566 domain-containing protein [candidate division KSB1 bacterium]|nr:DUF1566 domain-containing protein [candidate division KSB1 bacterium]